ncbi:SQS1 [Candida jiufengensis]|uniref:SQS1 n=1 Tax=Candida jiufengensis TaxID=497108 RepID=UPI0022249AD1|nr:SQS1 [Candida jiufengensis]KAI5951152.1 SQS1 [Candida jiufengensis]
MPKRGNRRTRGSSRGGRGGSRGGSSTRKIRGNKGRSPNNNTRSYNNSSSSQYQELFGDDSIYIPGKRGDGSMASMAQNIGRRKYSHFDEEINYTEDNRVNLMSKKFRDRPIEFIKAKEVYDPNIVLHKLSEQNKTEFFSKNEFGDIIDEDFKSISLDDSGEELEEEEGEDDEFEDFEELEEFEEFEEGEYEGEDLDNEVHDYDSTFENENDINNDSDEIEVEVIPKSMVKEEEEEEEEEEKYSLDEQETNKPKANLRLSEEQVDESMKENNIGFIRKNLEQEPENLEKVMSNDEVKIEEEIEEAAEVAREEIEEAAEVAQREVETSIQTTAEEKPVAEPLEETQDNNKKDNNSDEEFEIFIDDPKYETKSIIDISTQPTTVDEGEENEIVESDPEYGYLEDDYEFDVSKIEVNNVRFGIQNQYHVKCFDLTGFEDEFCWVDEDDVIQFVLFKGVKEKRLGKFLSYITKGMIDQEEPEEPEDDVYISDSSSEEEDSEVEFDKHQDDYPYDSDEQPDDDNLEDLIAYSKISSQGLVSMLDHDFSQNIPAKKRSKFDSLDIDPDMQEILTRQLNNYNRNKKLKKHDKKQQDLEEAILKNDMLIKYPVKITIKEVNKEFDSLLKDESRTTLSFPTLDSHAHKIITKMAQCYNMKVDKCGRKNIRHYLKISKTKTTYKYFPNYDKIQILLRGRPFFNRIDINKPKKEKITKSGGGNDSKAKFKEGDIVGAEAPEIDTTNLGRQMLEKLGWSAGQGLGVGNSGINEPIVAKVKMSKTGIR